MWDQAAGCASGKRKLMLTADRLEEHVSVPAGDLQSPLLIIMTGLPGSGKSSVATALASSIPAVVIRSDEVRKSLFHSPVYDRREHSIVHQMCHELICRLLRRGKVVISDATNLSNTSRYALARLAESEGARWLLVKTSATEQVSVARLSSRDKDDVFACYYSDADLKTYQAYRDKIEPINVPHYEIDTSAGSGGSLEGLIKDIVKSSKEEGCK